LRAGGFRAEVVGAHLDTLGARVRDAKVQKVPFVLVVGDDDVEHGTVGVNVRGTDRPERGVPVADFVERVRAVVDSRGNV
jgi:threonyl-tRNA synthetase